MHLYRPRHLAMTALVFLLLGGGGLVVGGAIAADAERSETWALDFEIPLPRQGDAGVYDLDEESTFMDSIGENRSLFEEDEFHFEWLDDRMLPTEDGALVLANRLRYHTEPNQVNGVREPIMEAGGFGPMAHGYLTRTTDDREEVDLRYHWLLIHDVPCFLRNDLQGQTRDITAEDVEATSPCKVPATGRTFSDAWEPLGILDEEGPTVVGFRREYSRGAFEASIEHWYQDGLAYPVRVIETWSNSLYDHEGRSEYRLKAFTPGGLPIATETVRTELPPLDPVPWPRLGPIDNPLDLHFSLAQALDAVRGEGASLLDRPETYLAYADHDRTTTDDGIETTTWWILVTDGADKQAWSVQHRTGPAQVDTPVALIPTVTTPMDDEPETTVTQWSADTSQTIRPPPDEMPSFASMATQWQAVSAPGGITGPADTWGLNLLCDIHCGDLVHLGQSSVAFDDGDLTREADSASALTSVMRYNGTQTYGYTETRWSSDAEPQSVAPTSGELEPVSRNAVWLPLSPAATVGVTLAALAAAAAYYVSPLLKHGALGLFSRIRPEAALEHPARERIIDAVEAHPGIHLRELARHTELHQSTALHHVRKLVQSGHLTSRTAGRYQSYFVRGAQGRDLHAAAGVLRTPAARQVLEAVASGEGLGTPDLLGSVAVGQSTLHYHLARLEKEGLIEGQRDGRRKSWQVTKLGQAALASGLAS